MTVQLRREKNNGIHFSIVDYAEVHDGGHGCVVLFSHMVGSRQADLLMVANMVEQTRLEHMLAPCRQRQAMSPKFADEVVCRRHVGNMSATFPTKMATF